MDYYDEIRAAAGDPRRLEELYRAARSAQEGEQFGSAMLACAEEAPDNVLFAAWRYRLAAEGAAETPTKRAERVTLAGANWRLAIPLSLAAGLLLWLLSDSRVTLPYGQPVLALLWAPLEAAFVVAYLMLSAKRPLRSYWAPLLGLAALAAVATVFSSLPGRAAYPVLMMIHLPVAALSATGLCLLGRHAGHANRFAFVSKTLEVAITGGIFAAAVGVFAGITLGLFEALGLALPEAVVRLLMVGGLGTVPVLAVASAYDPLLDPLQQKVEKGLGRLIPTLMWILLPLSLVVGAVYLLAIPFNFMGPFRSRELLIVYNVLLFAVLALLVGATPAHAEDLPARYGKWLRTGVLVLAAMAAVVSVYALSATVYRTLQEGITPNRLTVIGWNGINIGILVLLVYRMARQKAGSWIEPVHAAIGMGAAAYIVWTVLLVLGLPVIFR